VGEREREKERENMCICVLIPQRERKLKNAELFEKHNFLPLISFIPLFLLNELSEREGGGGNHWGIHKS